MKDVKKFFNNDRLNKGYANFNNNSQTDLNNLNDKLQHILPSSEVIAEYESLAPGSLAKIISIAEKEQAHKHKLDLENINSQNLARKMGRIFSLCLIFLICATSVAFGILDMEKLAIIFPAISFTIIGIIFTIFSCKARSNNRNNNFHYKKYQDHRDRKAN